MRRVSRLLNVLLLIVLFFSGFAPAFEARAAAPAAGSDVETVKVTFDNRTGGIIPELIFKGPQTYTYTNVRMGAHTFYIQKGKYNIRYQMPCGKKVKVKATFINAHFIRTEFCSTTGIVIDNKTGAPFELTLTLKGVTEYHFYVPVGKSKYDIFSGSYRFKAETACGTRNGRETFYSFKVIWNWYCTKPK